LLPTPVDLFVRRFLPDRFTRKRQYKFELRATGYNKIMEVPFLSGCFMALRTKALEQCGLFDERFFMYGEDIDFSRRINEQFKTMFYPHVSIVHGYEAASYKSLKMLKIHTQSIIRYFNKWGWFWDMRRDETNKRILSKVKQSG
jgi:GT2 family glycosyltransferase